MNTIMTVVSRPHQGASSTKIFSKQVRRRKLNILVKKTDISMVCINLGLQEPSEEVGLGWVPGGSKYLMRKYDWRILEVYI